MNCISIFSDFSTRGIHTTLNICAHRARMKAVRVHNFGGTEVLRCEEVPIPACVDNEVLVEIKASGINPVDTYIRAGTHRDLPKLPFTPGKDAAGIIKSLHPGIKNLQCGQRVFMCTMRKPSSGTYAQYGTFNVEEVYPLADKLTFSQGASVGIPYLTAYKALFLKAKAKAGDTVLIHGGSGGVGLAAVQIGKANGLNVLATAGTPEGMALVKECGAQQVFCHRENNYMEAIMGATGNKGVDVILEMLANVNLGKDLPILALAGRVIIVGSRGEVTIDPRNLMLPEREIIGVALPTTTKEEMQNMSDAILKGIDAGWVNPLIDKEYQLENAAQAHYDIIASKGAKGNFVFKI